jgi:hypothetical protein
MIRHSSRSGIPAGNPIANILVVIVGILTIAASIVLGFFAFLALGAIVLVTAAAIGLRAWWLNYKLGRQGSAKQGAARRGGPPGVIEGEYRVISRDRDEA